LAGVALAALASASLGPRYGGEIVVGVVGSLAPAGDAPRGQAARLLHGLVHETLVRTNDRDEVVPALAESVTASAGGRGFRLRLRADAVFHDGRRVTSHDAVRSLRAFLRGGSAAAEALARSLDGGPAFSAGASQELPGLSAPDERALDLRLVEAAPAALLPLAAANITSPGGAGCGPFVPLLAGTSRLALSGFAPHARGRPYLDRLVLRSFDTLDALRHERRGRRIDLAVGEPRQAALAAQLLLLLDKQAPPFDQSSVREAVERALDRDSFKPPLLAGAVPSFGWLAPRAPSADAADPAKAPEKLSAGITLAVDDEIPPLASQRVVAQLREIGIRASVVPKPPSQALRERAAARLLLFVPQLREPALLLRELALLSSAGAPAKDAIAAAEREASPERRREHLERAEAALRAETACLPIALLPIGFDARPGLHGVRIDVAGRVLLEDAWIEP
jgi:ABC-type transport system substrate-binding protein